MGWATSVVWLLCGASICFSAVVEIDGYRFTLPDGFTLQRVVDPQLVPRPVSASVDDQGRLFVTDSSGSNLPPSEQLKNPDHRILCLEDSTGDGIYDQVTVFAERVMFPQGCLWLDDWVYVAAPPALWRFRDSTGDGVADKREIWWDGTTLTGCANDLHGPYLGPDGYIYWTKGAFAEQHHDRPGQSPIQDRAAHIYRARRDGSGLEIIMSGGMDNPVGVTFTPDGEVLFTSTFIDFSEPGNRDGLAHATPGGVFGKPNDVIEDRRVPRTLPGLLKPFVQYGAGAPSGLHRYEGTALGVGYQNNVFATLFNLRKVTRHQLKPSGGSFASEDTDFLVCDHVDFHPTDVLEDADGSLLVVDTGGWYKLCCPSSQLAKKDVLGGIYRVRRAGSVGEPNPIGNELEWSEASIEDWVNRLRDKRPWVRHRARQMFRDLSEDRHAEAAAKLGRVLNETSLDPDIEAWKQQALWTLSELQSEEALRWMRVGLMRDSNTSIASVAARALARWPKAAMDAEALSKTLVSKLQDSESADPHLARALLEALHHFGQPTDLAALIQSSDLYPTLAEDPYLEHAWTWAMIGIGDSVQLKERLLDPRSKPIHQRMALMALAALPGALKPLDLPGYLHHPFVGVQSAAEFVIRRHPEWAEPLALWLKDTLFPVTLSQTETKVSLRDPDMSLSLSTQERLLTQVGRSGSGQVLLGKLALQPGVATGQRQAALKVMKELSGRNPPELWRHAVETLMQETAASPNPDEPLLLAILDTATAVPPSDQVLKILTKWILDENRSERLRRQSLRVLSTLTDSAVSDSVMQFALEGLAPHQHPDYRRQAAAFLTSAPLSGGQKRMLAQTIGEVSPLELVQLLGAFEPGGDEALGATLLTSLESKGTGQGLSPVQTRQIFARFPESVRARAEDWIRSVHIDLDRQSAHLDGIEQELALYPGDIRRGQEVFLSSETACFSCHRMGYQGGDFGPDLTAIGQARSERDLLESIVYPSASFVRSYEPVLIELTTGDTVGGILKSQNAQEVVLHTGPGQLQRIGMTDVIEVQPGTLSLMPGGLDAQLTRQQLADLIAFLKNTRWGAQ